jgi:mannose-6-phosphate isomerase-like protein (cupin superfamily)
MGDAAMRDGARATVAEARAKYPAPGGPRLSAFLFGHGSMELRFYKPPQPDPQTPHDQDELYIVHQGTGRFVCNDGRHDCAPGDVLFAPAGATHRFEDCSPEFCVWVVFYGPKGGE